MKLTELLWSKNIIIDKRFFISLLKQLKMWYNSKCIVKEVLLYEYIVCSI